MSTMHAIFEHAVRLGKIDANPARGVRRLAGKARERRLSRSEIARFGRAMRLAAEAGEHPTGLAAIRFLLLTGFRRMEGLGVKRLWLNAEEGSVRFPDTKSGAQTRVIGRAAMDLLLGQPNIASPYFFPADWGDGHFIGVVRVLDRLCASAKLDDVTPHTLRHTFASVAADLGFSELTIAALLGHAARGVTQRYIHIGRSAQARSRQGCRRDIRCPRPALTGWPSVMVRVPGQTPPPERTHRWIEVGGNVRISPTSTTNGKSVRPAQGDEATGLIESYML